MPFPTMTHILENAKFWLQKVLFPRKILLKNSLNITTFAEIFAKLTSLLLFSRVFHILLQKENKSFCEIKYIFEKISYHQNIFTKIVSLGSYFADNFFCNKLKKKLTFVNLKKKNSPKNSRYSCNFRIFSQGIFAKIRKLFR
jgi:hypothetical protein